MNEAQSKIDRMKARLILDYLIDAYQGTDAHSLPKKIIADPTDINYHLTELLRALQPATGTLLRKPQIMKRERRYELDLYKENRAMLFYVLMKKEGYPRRGAKAAAIKLICSELRLDPKTVERWGFPPNIIKQSVDAQFADKHPQKSEETLARWTFEYIISGLELYSREIKPQSGTSNR